ncbi:Os03g0821950 [Oryza sativa Japonica Group]|uniref:Os03g0821950 protein n=1 Tax=Oryza sativa subsp. japonica TaxID=39947 RepID=A0A0P0W5E2_ORYSJ|nr:hypothetical protein EE612_021354 [Oryza sativa]BAS87103.1 Os03g0821950 [Oryza sativa Japonica Group]
MGADQCCWIRTNLFPSFSQAFPTRLTAVLASICSRGFFACTCGGFLTPLCCWFPVHMAGFLKLFKNSDHSFHRRPHLSFVRQALKSKGGNCLCSNVRVLTF